MPTDMSDHPRPLRAHTSISGLAVLSRSSSECVACIVEDLSPAGARVTFSDVHALPERFDLYLGPNSKLHRVRTIWRGGNTVGVQFLEPRADAPEVMPG